jgi:hypothetical protein
MIPPSSRRLPGDVAALALIGAAAFAGMLSAQVAASAAISGLLVEVAGKPLAFTTIWLVLRDTLLRSRGTLRTPLAPSPSSTCRPAAITCGLTAWASSPSGATPSRWQLGSIWSWP